MNAEGIAKSLGGRKAGDSWVARCPAHDDRHPSLSIREREDGTVLLRDFGGCSVESILGAVGLEFDALFPEHSYQWARPINRPWRAVDLVNALGADLAQAFVFQIDIANGRPISDADRVTARENAERIAHFLDELRRAR